VKRRIVLVLTIVAALAVAATVRPPRAAPAFSYAGQPEPTSSCFSCHPERSERKRAKSKGRRRSSHLRRSRSHRAFPIVDLNHADADALARLPGVGDYLARRIVEYRELVGPFESLDDLSDLDGISSGRLASLGRYVVVR
jgi:hypothetical protein